MEIKLYVKETIIFILRVLFLSFKFLIRTLFGYSFFIVLYLLLSLALIFKLISTKQYIFMCLCLQSFSLITNIKDFILNQNVS